MKLAALVRQFAEEKSATPGQVALAWLLHQGNDIVPIPGTKRRKYLEENLAAAALELSPANGRSPNCRLTSLVTNIRS
jgi:aryl-alcohol dehydrogenase-like predicted oxidoreductase